jgi:hypothetical protein
VALDFEIPPTTRTISFFFSFFIFLKKKEVQAYYVIKRKKRRKEKGNKGNIPEMKNLSFPSSKPKKIKKTPSKTKNSSTLLYLTIQHLFYFYLVHPTRINPYSHLQ